MKELTPTESQNHPTASCEEETWYGLPSLIHLVTEPSPTVELFNDYLHQQLGCTVVMRSPRATLRSSDGSHLLVLLDVDHLDEAALHHWQRQAEELSKVTLAALNLRNEDHAVKLLNSLNLSGVFYRSDSLPLICKGLSLLCKGQPWMTRSLMARLLENYRHRQLNLYRPTCGLTHREVKILGLLVIGASRTQIAEHFFVSEHTVKSHLYNIFKKIGVHTSSQAADWARAHLGPAPPLEPHSLPRSYTPH